jgi:hypothetical protein
MSRAIGIGLRPRALALSLPKTGRLLRALSPEPRLLSKAQFAAARATAYCKASKTESGSSVSVSLYHSCLITARLQCPPFFGKR